MNIIYIAIRFIRNVNFFSLIRYRYRNSQDIDPSDYAQRLDNLEKFKNWAVGEITDLKIEVSALKSENSALKSENSERKEETDPQKYDEQKLTVKLFVYNGEDCTKLMEFLDNFREKLDKYHEVQFIPIGQDNISELAERDIVVGFYLAFTTRLELTSEWDEITKKCSNCLVVAWRPGSSVDNMSPLESSTFPSGINLKTEKPTHIIIEIFKDVPEHIRNQNNVKKLFSLIYEVAGFKIKEKKPQKNRDKKEYEMKTLSLTKSSMTEHEPSKIPCGNEECYRKLVCCVKRMDHFFHSCRKDHYKCNWSRLYWPRQCVLCTTVLERSCQMCENCSKQFCDPCKEKINKH